MATQEFLQEGSTSGQRLAALQATEPPEKLGRPRKEIVDVPASSASADRFAANFLERVPSAVAPSQPAPDPFEGYTDQDLSRMLHKLQNRGVAASNINPESAAVAVEAMEGI